MEQQQVGLLGSRWKGVAGRGVAALLAVVVIWAGAGPVAAAKKRPPPDLSRAAGGSDDPPRLVLDVAREEGRGKADAGQGKAGKTGGSPVQVRVLANGATVWCARVPGSTTVRVLLAVAAGSRLEPPKRSGLSALHAQLLRLRLNRPKHAVKDPVPVGGASWRVRTGREWLVLEAGVEGRRLKEALGLLATVGGGLDMSDLDLAAARRSVAGSLTTGWRGLPEHRLEAQLFKGHPLGRRMRATTRGHKRLKRAMLEEWHRGAMVGRRLRLLLVGDLACAKAFPLTVAAIGALRKGAAPDWGPSAEPQVSSIGRGATRLPGLLFVSTFAPPGKGEQAAFQVAT